MLTSSQAIKVLNDITSSEMYQKPHGADRHDFSASPQQNSKSGEPETENDSDSPQERLGSPFQGQNQENVDERLL